jgi:hypothetical protein
MAIFMYAQPNIGLFKDYTHPGDVSFKGQH